MSVKEIRTKKGRALNSTLTQIPNNMKIKKNNCLKAITNSPKGFMIAIAIMTLFGSHVAGAQSAPATIPSTAIVEELIDRSADWAVASGKGDLLAKQKIAEEIGEDGVRKLIRSRGGKVLLDPRQKGLKQGFDFVAEEKGTRNIKVIDSKGGNSGLKSSYGHPQASPEWSVKASERTLKSTQSSPTEKKAARRVLNAAAEGKLSGEVARTRHKLGTPTSTKVLDSYPSGNEKVARMARQLQPSASPKVSPSSKGFSPSAPTKSLSSKSISHIAKGGKILSRAALPVAIVADGISRGKEAHDLERKFREGKVSQSQRIRGHAANASSAVGGWTAAAAGAWAGAEAGTIIGSFGGPVGAGVGAVAGSIIGGAAGYLGAEWGIRSLF